MKLCRNCKWVYGRGPYAKCCAPRVIAAAETGYCLVQRSSGWIWSRLCGLCGLEGRWFEPKKKA